MAIGCRFQSEEVDPETDAWGTWPGAAALAGHPSKYAGLEPSAKKRASDRSHGSLQRFYHRTDRIIFNGQPPVPPPHENTQSFLSGTLVLVSNLAWWFNDCDLREAAQHFGQVRAVRILSHPNTHESLGLALVNFTTSSAAAAFSSERSSVLKRRSQTPVEFFVVPSTIVDAIKQETGDADAWIYGYPLSLDMINQLAELANQPLLEQLHACRDKQTSAQVAPAPENQPQLPCVAAAAAAAVVLKTLQEFRNASHPTEDDELAFLQSLAPEPFSKTPLHPFPNVEPVAVSKPRPDESLVAMGQVGPGMPSPAMSSGPWEPEPPHDFGPPYANPALARETMMPDHRGYFASRPHPPYKAIPHEYLHERSDYGGVPYLRPRTSERHNDIRSKFDPRYRPYNYMMQLPGQYNPYY